MPEIICRENLRPTQGVLLCLALHRSEMGVCTRCLSLKCFSFSIEAWRSLLVICFVGVYQYVDTQGKTMGLPLVVPWNACTRGVRKWAYGTLPPGIQLGRWKAVKSGFGSFHLGYEVQLLHGTEVCCKWIHELASWNCCRTCCRVLWLVSLSLHHTALFKSLK